MDDDGMMDHAVNSCSGNNWIAEEIDKVFKIDISCYNC